MENLNLAKVQSESQKRMSSVSKSDAKAGNVGSS